MSVSVEEFMKKNTKPNSTKVSVLKKFEDDIRALLKNGFSTPKIYDFLQQNGVKIELVTLYQYIARHNLRDDDKEKIKTLLSAQSVKQNLKKQVTLATKKPVINNKKSPDKETFIIDDVSLSELI